MHDRGTGLSEVRRLLELGLLLRGGGGLLGGYVISRQGLKFWLWPMVCIIHLPDAMFIYLSYAQPESLAVISAAVATIKATRAKAPVVMKV